MFRQHCYGTMPNYWSVPALTGNDLKKPWKEHFIANPNEACPHHLSSEQVKGDLPDVHPRWYVISSHSHIDVRIWVEVPFLRFDGIAASIVPVDEDSDPVKI